MISLHFCNAVVLLLQIKTPLPEANPSAFITIGAFIFFMYSLTPFMLLKDLYCAVGILYFLQSCFVKDLDFSNLDAALDGPNTKKSFFSK